MAREVKATKSRDLIEYLCIDKFYHNAYFAGNLFCAVWLVFVKQNIEQPADYND
jgi:hypothetical protein